MFQFSSEYSFLDEGIKNFKRKKGKNMTTPYANYFVIIMGNFRPFYQRMRTEIITFFRTLLFSELYCRITCNLKYIHLFLIGSWTTTSWRIYHQAFSVTIPSWSGCKSGVFFEYWCKSNAWNPAFKGDVWMRGWYRIFGLSPDKAALTHFHLEHVSV